MISNTEFVLFTSRVIFIVSSSIVCITSPYPIANLSTLSDDGVQDVDPSCHIVFSYFLPYLFIIFGLRKGSALVPKCVTSIVESPLGHIKSTFFPIRSLRLKSCPFGLSVIGSSPNIFLLLYSTQN